MKTHHDLKNGVRQMGVTLLEMISFIGLAAVVIAAALVFYGSANAAAVGSDLYKGVRAIALGLGQAANNRSAQAVEASLVEPPAGWSIDGNAWVHPRATLSFVNNNDGTFKLQLANISSDTVVKELVGKTVGNQPGVAAGDREVAWDKISFSTPL